MLTLKEIKPRIKKVKERIRKFFGIRLIKSIRDLIIFQQNAEFKRKHSNPLNLYGKQRETETTNIFKTMKYI